MKAIFFIFIKMCVRAHPCNGTLPQIKTNLMSFALIDIYINRLVVSLLHSVTNNEIT